jgi:hypothetical protein
MRRFVVLSVILGVLACATPSDRELGETCDRGCQAQRCRIDLACCYTARSGKSTVCAPLQECVTPEDAAPPAERPAGDGIVQPCADPKFKCAPAAGNTICVAGRVFEAASAIVKGSAGEPIKLTSDRLKVAAYDPLAFASNPTGVQPIGVASEVDDQGCFIIPKVKIPDLSPYISVAVDDAGADDNYVATARAMATAYGKNLDRNIVIPAFRRATIDAWSTEAGGANLADAGSAIIEYRAGATPISGLVPLQDGKEPGSWTSPGDLFYLGADPAVAPYLDKAATATTASGAVLIRKAAQTTYGGQKADCTITPTPAGSAPGWILFLTAAGSGSGC